MTINLDKTLSQLDSEAWGKATDGDSSLVQKVLFLRNKPLKQFTIEDLRLLIGQNFNLEILIPLALDRLKENILAEGDFYEGDLLNSVLRIDANYWTNHQGQHAMLKGLYQKKRDLFDSDNSFRKIRKSFDSFDQNSLLQ
jgi:hypothetical protein